MLEVIEEKTKNDGLFVLETALKMLDRRLKFVAKNWNRQLSSTSYCKWSTPLTLARVGY